MRTVRATVLAAALVASGSCDSGTAPSAVDRIEIRLTPARSSYPLTDTVRAHVIAFSREGTWVVSTGPTTWQSLTPTLATVGQSGLITAGARGEATIQAQLEGKTAQIVVPIRGILHRGFVLNVSETWRVADTPHVVAAALNVGGINGGTDTTVLTIEPGATIRFRPGAGLGVGGIDPGALRIAAGGDPVIMEGDSAARASWMGISIGRSRSELRNVRMRHCGHDAAFGNPSSCIRVSGEVLLEVVTISDAHNALEIGNGARILPGSRDLSVTNTDGFVATVSPDMVAAFPRGGQFTANADSELVIIGGNVRGSATWTEAGLPWRMRGTVTVGPNSPVLTLPPGFHLRVDPLASLTIEGKLRAGDLAGPPVILEASGSDWDGIRLNHGAGSFLRNVELRDCGVGPSPASFSACLVFSGVGGVDTGLIVQDVTIRDSRSVGVFADCCSIFHPSSSNLTITGSAREALLVRPYNVATIPVGSYSGNGVNAIRVWGAVIDQTQTWPNLGVPYLFPEGLSVGSSLGPMTLTIEPGVTLRMGVATMLAVGTGTLRAVGTASDPITFGSATPGIPGSWFGLAAGGTPESVVQLEYVEILDAGAGSPGFSGALRLQADPGGLLRNSTIRRSLGCGMILFNGASWTDDYTDPIYGNTFIDIVGPLRCQAPV